MALSSNELSVSQPISDWTLSSSLKTHLNYRDWEGPRIILSESQAPCLETTCTNSSLEFQFFSNSIWKKPFSQMIRKETRNDHDELKHLSHEKLILSSLPTISFLFSMPILRRESTLLTNFNFIPFQNWFLTLYI